MPDIQIASNIVSLIEHLITEIEGKSYSNDADDAGRETLYGFSKKYHPEIDFANFTYEDAIKKYYRDYWFQRGLNKVAEIYFDIAAELFEAGVNISRSKSTKYFQRLLNVFNKQGELYPDIAEDGNIGEQTIHALLKFYSHRGHEGIVVLLKSLNHLQGSYYIERAIAREINEKFVYGWLLKRT